MTAASLCMSRDNYEVDIEHLFTALLGRTTVVTYGTEIC